MKLISKKSAMMPTIQHAPNEPHVMEAVAVLGDADTFFGFMVPKNLTYITEHQESALRKGKSRSTALLCRAYGEQAVRRNMAMFFVWLKRLWLTDWQDDDIAAMVGGILATKEARLLDYISLLGFFKYLADGRAKLYKATYREVMEAFQTYCPAAKTREASVKARIEAERKPRIDDILSGEQVAELMKKYNKPDNH